MPNWPHASIHILDEAGTYMVTAGTYQKAHWLHDAARLQTVHDALLNCADRFGWRLQARAVLSNHYHFIANAPDAGQSLRLFLHRLHGMAARWLNERDNRPGRKAWFQYYDGRITYCCSP